MAPAFDKSPSFAFSKNAETACANLDGAGLCAIHAHLMQKGFSGCVVYDCLGAGQRVTQELFDGRSWLEEPRLKTPMAQAFAVMRRIHTLLELLYATDALPLDAGERQQAGELIAQLNPPAGWSEDALKQAPMEEIATAAKAFLQSLKHHAPSRA